MTKSKHFKWIPWQLRLSARQYQEAMEARSHKVARTEAQPLTHAFFDETPEVSVEGRALTASWLHRTQQVFRNALALCQAVHLLNAKALDQQIASMCLTQPDPTLSLRTVTTSRADRQIWGTIVDLLHRKWSMDDAFHELTHGRMEIHSLLMLRPKISKAMPALPPAKQAQLSPKRPASRPQKSEPPQRQGKRKVQKTPGPPRTMESLFAAGSKQGRANQTTASLHMCAR